MDGTSGESKSRCDVSVHSQHSSVTANNSSGGRQVLVTPLSSVQCEMPSGSFMNIGNRRQVVITPQYISTLQPNKQHFIDKTIFKAVCQNAKKDVPQAFTLCNIDTSRVLSCNDLKSVIWTQLQHYIISDNFDVGYVQGTCVVRVRSKEDLVEMWTALSKPNSKITLWCDGLKDIVPKPRANHKCKQEDNSDNKDDSSRKKQQPSRKEEEVPELVEGLKEKHGSTFTQIQYRIWGEMIAGGLHASTDDPPSTSVFTRAGGITPL